MNEFSFDPGTDLLDFGGLLKLLGRYIHTPEGAKRLAALRPHRRLDKLEAQHARAQEAGEYLRLMTGSPAAPGKQASQKSAGLLRLDFGGIADLDATIARLRLEGSALEAAEIAAILLLLDRASDFKHILTAQRERMPALAGVASHIGEFRGILREMSGKVLPDGTLDDHASLELWRLRREIEKQKQAVQESLQSFLRQHADAGTLQEELVTIRNERFVVPIKAGARKRLEGVIHGASSTGQTVFVEPMQTIQLNNELVDLIEQEQQEVHRILRDMTAALRVQTAGVQMALEVITELDLAFAKGRFCVDFRCTAPRFNQQQRLLLREARHPLLEEVLRRRARGAGGPAGVVPMSLDLDRDHRVLVISGPNTGGKTVALKTVGLLALAAHCGIPVPAAEAEFPLLDRVLADIGDYQSIQESLSTFSAHMSNIQRMIDQVRAGASESTLVLLDELGAATDPQEGGALGVAIVDYFLKAGAMVLASTHHLALKAYATNTPGVLNASVGFDEETLQPTFKLIVGVPGKSSGLAIAQRLGMRADVLARAREALSTQDEEVSRLLAQLHTTTGQAEQLRAELAARERELRERTTQLAAESEKREKKRLAELERTLAAVLDDFEKQSRALIQQIEDKRLQKEAEKRVARSRREARERFDSAVVEQLGSGDDEAESRPAEPSLLTVKEGDMVRVKALGRDGVVRRRLDFSNLEVEVGNMKMKVSLDQVEAAKSSAKPPALPRNVTVTTESGTGAATEINVIGCTADEARDRVDKFLDSAVLASLSRVRVVHGHGMGVLRKTLHEFFGKHPQVQSFAAAPQQEGGAGATIVELRV